MKLQYMISYIEPRTHEEKMPMFAATLVCVCVCVAVLVERSAKLSESTSWQVTLKKANKCHTSSACRILELWGAIG